MNKKVLFALRLYDAFSGKIINSKALKFKLGDGYVSPIQKSDDYFIFLDEGLRQVKLTIQATTYWEYEKEIDINQLDPSFPVVEVRLVPNASYESVSTKHIKGTISQGNTSLWLIPQVEKPLLKYGGLVDQNRRVIKINTLQPIPIIQLPLMPKESLDQGLEIWVPRRKIDYNAYEIESAPGVAYGINSEVIRVYPGKSEASGFYDVIVDDLYQTSRWIVAYKQGEEVIKEKMAIE